MNEILNWGIEVIKILQQYNPEYFVTFMKVLTHLGSEPAYLIMLPIVIWCFDFKTGVRTGVLFLLSAYLNFIFKEIIAQPRPFMLEPGLQLVGLIQASDYGLPSGHAQGSLVFFGMLALLIRKRIFTVIASALILLIAFSRVYLGVHFPTDILGGWLLGGILLYGYSRFGENIEKKLGEQTLNVQFFSAIFISGLMLINLSHETIGVTGAFSGLCIGIIITLKLRSNRNPQHITHYFIRTVIGLFVSVLIYAGLAKLFPQKGVIMYEPMRFVRYLLLFLWIACGSFGVFQFYEKNSKIVTTVN